jgi:hypothetical protein
MVAVPDVEGFLLRKAVVGDDGGRFVFIVIRGGAQVSG